MMWYEKTKWEKFCNIVGGSIGCFTYITMALCLFGLFIFAAFVAILMWANITDSMSIFLAICFSGLSLSLLSLFFGSLQLY